MRTITMPTAAATPAFLLALLCAAPARADGDPPHALGDHPAIVVQRLHRAAGYDYASKFYPHPARLCLYAEAPHEAANPVAGPGSVDAARPAPDDPPGTCELRR